MPSVLRARFEQNASRIQVQRVTIDKPVREIRDLSLLKIAVYIFLSKVYRTGSVNSVML
jgi:hypothetical protein